MTGRTMVLLVLLGSVAPAWAAAPPKPGDVVFPDKDDPDTERSKSFFVSGISAYEAGDYKKALEHLEAGRKLAPKPGFDFNIARCHDRLGNYPKAVEEYKRFVAAEKSYQSGDTMIAEAKRRIAVLEQRIADERREVLERSKRKKSHRALLVTSFSLTGVAVLSAIVGGVLYDHVGDGIERIKLECSGFCEDRKAPLRTYERASVGLFITSGATAAGAIGTGVAYGILRKEKPEKVSVTPVFNPNFVGLVVGGSF